MANWCRRVTYNTDFADAERATINMIHDNMDLTVSADVRIMALWRQLPAGFEQC
jgi:hypothetical protein